MSVKLKFILISLAGVVALLLDQITKNYFVANQGSQITIWEPLLFFSFQGNPNVAFGLPINIVIYIIMTAIIFGLLVYMTYQTLKRKEVFQFALIIFIIAGALGNIIDRIRFGYVIDFIHVPFWSIFNLADIYIVIAVILWMGYIIFYESKRKKVPKES
ncbi:signal peptidase II [Patescibacteria group bacterium]|nr:signal peptidase II [Patescibacteria group bacterium]MBU1673032.1 signal peptidase II [Patescibacteria group bacterium]MBU1963592.1 signal peptidase II [Patescibacteria group bacterium]